MSVQPRNTIKAWFQRGLKPLQDQFASWMDSFWHKTEDSIPISAITDLQTTLNSLATNAALTALIDGAPSAGNTLNKLYNLISGIGQFAGGFDASGGALPTVGSAPDNSIRKGDYWIITVGGTNTLGIFKPGDVIFAKVTGALVAADFFGVETNADLASPTIIGLVKLFSALGTANDGAIDQNTVTRALQDLSAVVGTAAGTDTYTLSLTPNLDAYRANQTFVIKFTNANTGAATLNINGLGAKAIKKNVSAALIAGDIKAGQIVPLSYDGTNFQVIGGGSNDLTTVLITGNNAGAQQIKNLADPTSAQDADTKAARDAAIAAAIANLVNSAPGALDTLKELADALGDDPNFSTTINTAIGIRQKKLNPTGEKTGTYAMQAFDLVPFDLTSANGIANLSATPSDGDMVLIKIVKLGGAYTVTVNCGGADTFNKAGGSTSLTLSLLNQAVALQYKASLGVWYVISDDLSLSQLDSRYLLQSNIDTDANLAAYSDTKVASQKAVKDYIDDGDTATEVYLYNNFI